MALRHAPLVKPVTDFWSRLSLVRRLVAVTAALIVTAAVIQAAAVLGVSSYVASDLEGQRVDSTLDAASRHIAMHIDEFRRVPLILANTPPISRIADQRTSQDPQDEATALWRRHLGSIFRSIIMADSSLQQARFIGVADGGREIIRVTRTPEGVELISANNLERKSDQPYFQTTIRLSVGNVYMSPIDLSLDTGAAEDPAQPIIIAATPIFSSSGKLFGIVTVCAAPDVWMRNLANLAGFSKRFMAANHNGDYLHRSEGGRQLALAGQAASVVQRDWPDLAPIFRADGPDKMTVRKDGHVVSAARIRFNPGEPSQFIVLATDSDTTRTFGDTWKIVLLGLVLALALTAAGVFAAYLVSRPLRSLTSAARKIATGAPDQATPDNRHSNAEGGEIGETLRIMKEAVTMRDNSLRSSEAQLRAIVDNTLDGLITIDRDSIIRHYNPACEEIFGYTEGEALGRSVTMLMPSSEVAKHEVGLDHYLRTGEGTFVGARRELTGRRKSGELIDIEIAVAQIEIEGDVLFSGVIRDITERKRIERLKTEFVSTVTHELRTPLTSIMGSLGLLRAGKVGDLPEKVARMVGLAHDNGKRLTNLINDILDIDRLEAGAIEFTRTTENLRQLVEQEVARLSKEAAVEGVTLDLVDVPADIELDTDRDRLAQVLWNLLSNAVKFSPAGGTVRVRAEMLGDRVRVSVSDAGPGIAESFRARVFQKFAQADSSDTRQKGGTGLGLSITKAIVERFGGTIGFDSKVGGGTTFHFEMPALQSRNEERGKQDVAALRADASADAAGVAAPRPRLLHVESDRDMSAVLAEIIGDVADMTAVATYGEALPLLVTQRFDVVILDTYPHGDVLRALTQREGPMPRVLVYSVDEAPTMSSGLVSRRLVKSRTDILTLRAHILELLRELSPSIKRSA